MLTERHVSEIKTAAETLRRNWEDWQWVTVREAMTGMADRLDAVVKEASKWKPPGEPTPIKDLYPGEWFMMTPHRDQEYVRIRFNNGVCVYAPGFSKHGVSTEDLPEGVTFYPAPSPTQLMAMCSEQKAKE